MSFRWNLLEIQNICGPNLTSTSPKKTSFWWTPKKHQRWEHQPLSSLIKRVILKKHQLIILGKWNQISLETCLTFSVLGSTPQTQKKSGKPPVNYWQLLSTKSKFYQQVLPESSKSMWKSQSMDIIKILLE